MEGGAGAVDFLKDCGAFGLPGVWLWGSVAIGKIGLDVSNEFTDRSEAPGADHVAVKSAKKRSTRFIHDDDVGVK